jgi:hypothetical protein
MRIKLLLVLLVGICLSIPSHSQDGYNENDSLTSLPVKFFGKVSRRVTSLQNKLDRRVSHYLAKLKKQEARLRKKLASKDSLAAATLCADATAKYKALEEKLGQLPKTGDYFPYLDTLKTSLKFIGNNQQLAQFRGKADNALGNIGGLENEFKKAEIIKHFIAERRNLLRKQLSQYGFARELRNLNKDIYYYSQVVTEYKSLLQQPEKLERKAIDFFAKTKVFQDFLKTHSLLFSLFSLPEDPSGVAYQANLAGLQTRTQVNQLVQQQFTGVAGNPSSMMQQQIQQAQQHLQQLKDKINQAVARGSGGDMPEGMRNFKPNNQKTKSFLKRLELGTNVQSTKTKSFLPATTDLAMSVGYRLNDKSVIGVGASYKVGWGKDIKNIVLTSEGAGLRSFIEVQLKGSFNASGGYEYNYQPAIIAISGQNQAEAWTQSGLLGISKVVSLKSKFFKKTRVQLLWDFLSYQQVPQTPAVKFRMGYIF